MGTQSLTAYAAAHGLSLPKLLAFYRRGLVPEYMGRVANPPISVAAWSAKNGISRRTGLALYREEKCPRGVLLGQRSAAAYMIQLVTGALLEFPEARKAVIAAVEGAEEERNRH